MNKNRPTFILLALLALAMPAAAQDIYRCGDSYSQKPCPGGALVQAEDARSASQRSQTSEAAQRDAKTADAMEKARLKEEAKPVQAYIPAAKVEAGTGKPKKPAEFKAATPNKTGATKKKKTQPEKKAA